MDTAGPDVVEPLGSDARERDRADVEPRARRSDERQPMEGWAVSQAAEERLPRIGIKGKPGQNPTA